MSKLLSQGGYGCVFYPSITCSGRNSTNKTKVSKLQRKDWAAKNEVKIGNSIKKIMNHDLFFLPIIDSCDINISSVDKSLVSECRVVQKKPNADYVLMKMKYLENITFTDYLISGNHSNIYVLSKVVQSFKSLANSLKILNEHHIVHHDLKLDNILIGSKNHAPIIIDFGISLDMKKINSNNINLLDDYFYVDAPDYYPWPLEVHIINYIVQTRINSNYDNSPMNVNELKKIAELWCESNAGLDLFNESFKSAFLKKCYHFVRQFKGKSNTEILDILLSTYMTWDVYSLSVIYMKVVGFLFNNEFPDTNFISEFVQLNLINLSPNPNDRLGWNETLNYINDIVNRDSSLKDLEITVDSININANTITNSIKSERKALQNLIKHR